MEGAWLVKFSANDVAKIKDHISALPDAKHAQQAVAHTRRVGDLPRSAGVQGVSDGKGVYSSRCRLGVIRCFFGPKLDLS